MKKCLMALAVLLVASAASAQADVFLDMSSVLNYDAVVSAGELEWANTNSKGLMVDIPNGAGVLGGHGFKTGANTYAYLSDDLAGNNLPTDGLVTVGGDRTYQLGTGITPASGYDVYGLTEYTGTETPSKVKNSLFVSKSGGSAATWASTVLTLAEGQQAAYDSMNVLFSTSSSGTVGSGKYAVIAIQVKYVGDDDVWLDPLQANNPLVRILSTANGQLSQIAGHQGLGGDAGLLYQGTDTTHVAEHQVAENYVNSATRATAASDALGSTYMYDFETPLELDESKTLKAIRFSVLNQSTSSTNNQNLFVFGVTAIPEPATMALLGLGMVGLVVRKKRAAK